MDQKYDHTPEVAPQNFPEVAHQHYGYQHSYHATTPDGTHSPYFTTHDGSTTYGGHSPQQPFAQPTPQPSEKQRKESMVCGCPLLVFILTCIIAVLSAAVIGLAAGTGVVASRASEYSDQLASMSAALPTKTSTSTATPTSFNSLTDGCSDDPASNTKTTYTSFSLFGSRQFVRYCDRDAQNDPLLALFAANFDTCMDACAAWNKYSLGLFGDNGTNKSCDAVSFIPLWTDKKIALEGAAPGNCYLKPGPQGESNLKSNNIGTEVHSALRVGAY